MMLILNTRDTELRNAHHGKLVPLSLFFDRVSALTLPIQGYDNALDRERDGIEQLLVILF